MSVPLVELTIHAATVMAERETDAAWLELALTRPERTEADRFDASLVIVLDFNADKQVVGIEVLDLRKRVPSANLKEMQFDVA